MKYVKLAIEIILNFDVNYITRSNVLKPSAQKIVKQ
jgi:hypothetical protein